MRRANGATHCGRNGRGYRVVGTGEGHSWGGTKATVAAQPTTAAAATAAAATTVVQELPGR